MLNKIEKQTSEAYEHIKPYLKDQNELYEMCKHCENYCGKNHDYEECRNSMCFKFYLAYVYLDWDNNCESWCE